MTDINDNRPTSISHLIGQEHVRNVVTLGLDYAHQENRKFDHAMMVGPPGLGKTQTAMLGAKAHLAVPRLQWAALADENDIVRNTAKAALSEIEG